MTVAITASVGESKTPTDEEQAWRGWGSGGCHL